MLCWGCPPTACPPGYFGCRCVALTRQVIFRCWRRRHRVTPPPRHPPTSPPCHPLSPRGAPTPAPPRPPPRWKLPGQAPEQRGTRHSPNCPRKGLRCGSPKCPRRPSQGCLGGLGRFGGGGTGHKRDSGEAGSPPNVTEPPPQACATAMGKRRRSQGDPRLSHRGAGGRNRGDGGGSRRDWFWGGSRWVSPEGDPERVCGIPVVPLGPGGEVLCEFFGGSQVRGEE